MDGRLAFMVPIRGRQYLGAAFENVFHEHMSIGVLNWTCHKCPGETISWSWSSIYQMTNFVDGWTVPAQAWVSTEWGLIKEGVFLFVLLSLIVSDFVFGLSCVCVLTLLSWSLLRVLNTRKQDSTRAAPLLHCFSMFQTYDIYIYIYI